MKLKVLFLALFVAGLAASLAIAKPPPGKGNPHGGAAPTASTTAGSTAAPLATLPASGKVVLCHKTGKATKWVRISVNVHAAKQRIAKGDVWLQDPAGACGTPAAATTTGATTTAATTTATTTTATATTATTTTVTTTTAGTTTTSP